MPAWGRSGLIALAALAACAERAEKPQPAAVVVDAGAPATSTVALVASEVGRIELLPASTQLGVTRALPAVVREGPSAEDPTIAVLPDDGRVLLAHVARAGPREHIELRSAPSGASLGPLRAITRGERAWHPRLAVAADGAAWMVWCGLDRPVERGDHQREVMLMYVAPGAPGAPILVSPKGDSGRHCDPEIATSPDGIVHVVWEAPGSAPFSSRIAYRRFSPGGEPLGAVEMVSPGPFDRRPAIAATSTVVYVAWDALVGDVPSGSVDPDYDLFLAIRAPNGGFSPPVTVDAGEGIQAAPALEPAPGGALVAYHTSEPHGLVKWWTLRRVRGRAVEKLAAPDPGAAILPQGQLQGAELPAIVVDRTGRIVVATRASHGAYFHVIDAEGVSPAFDLTRRGWGARGLRMDMAVAADGSILLVRRARHDVILERFTLAGGGGSPRFEPVQAVSKPKPKRDPKLAPVPVRSKISDAFAKATIYFGDVHMHSGVSDGTGPPDEIYARARTRGQEFAMLTDHDYVVGARMMLSEHDEIAWLTDRFDAERGFTTIHAYEWTSRALPEGSGHKNVYFRSYAPSVTYDSKNGHGTTRLLQKALRKENAFTAPHHTGWTGTDWDEADPNIQRHVEIVSVHGAFEDPDHQPLPTRAARRGMFAVDGLRRGKRFGFLGGSDGHGILWHHGVGRRMDPWAHGLTGAIATSDDRGAIWDALHARRTFATSGARMWILTAIAGVPQGAETSVSAAPLVEWEAEGTEALRQVVVVRDGRIIHEVEAGELRHAGSFRDETAKPGWHSYYVRAHQGSGIEGTDVVWSSPIFVQVTEGR